MGYGDELMGSGLARGAAKRGKLIAFGDPRIKRIDWSSWCEMIYRYNPNIARPGQENLPNLEWINYRRRNRIYNTLSHDRWIWNYQFKAIPGELFFTPDEQLAFSLIPFNITVVIEPNVPIHKPVAPNKQWPIERYQFVADELLRNGFNVIQFDYGPAGRYRLTGVNHVVTSTFREAAIFLSRVDLYIGAEGGLHHAAAAVGIRAVVIFGGFIPPQVTGYDSHINLTGGVEACGMLSRCEHCFRAMDCISADEVLAHAQTQLALADQMNSGAFV